MSKKLVVSINSTEEQNVVSCADPEIFFEEGGGGPEGYLCLLGKGEGIRGLFSVIFTL